MTCIIIDDEHFAIEVLEHLIKKVPYLELLGSFTNPIEGMECVRQKMPDITFLDIQMEEMSGVEVAKLIKGKTKIIFTTAHSEFAVGAFEDDALDYLMKPISLERFMKAIQKMPNQEPKETPAVNTSEFLFLKSDVKGKANKIHLNEIISMEAFGNYVKFHKDTADTPLALLTFKELIERLPTSQFMRVHKSHIVAINRITGIEGNEIIVGQKPKEIRIPIGVTYREDLLAIIKPHMIGGRI